jgi:hypothetical protein
MSSTKSLGGGIGARSCARSCTRNFGFLLVALLNNPAGGGDSDLGRGEVIDFVAGVECVLVSFLDARFVRGGPMTGLAATLLNTEDGITGEDTGVFLPNMPPKLFHLDSLPLVSRSPVVFDRIGNLRTESSAST